MIEKLQHSGCQQIATVGSKSLLLLGTQPVLSGFFIMRIFSSDGQSGRLIPGWAQVRVLEDPPIGQTSTPNSAGVTRRDSVGVNRCIGKNVLYYMPGYFSAF